MTISSKNLLSILISSRNGEKTLPLMLDSLYDQTLDKSFWKVIVVDNGSTDKTRAILDSYRNRLPISILTEQRPGKNRALNLALSEIVGDLVIFSDDDVIFSKDWLEKYRRAADENPDFDIFGGPILPNWPMNPEDWILNYVPLGTVFAITEGVIREGECSIGVVWGPNFSIRRDVLEHFGRLPENIGPSGTQYAMGSESAFLYRLAENGHRSFFINQATVQHIIRPNQLERSWILGRAQRFGRGQCRLGFDKSGPVAELMGFPRWIMLGLVQAFFKSRLTTDVGKKFMAEWDFNYAIGYIQEYCLCRKELDALWCNRMNLKVDRADVRDCDQN